MQGLPEKEIQLFAWYLSVMVAVISSFIVGVRVEQKKNGLLNKNIEGLVLNLYFLLPNHQKNRSDLQRLISTFFQTQYFFFSFPSHRAGADRVAGRVQVFFWFQQVQQKNPLNAGMTNGFSTTIFKNKKSL